jgi:hypothetical protein
MNHPDYTYPNFVVTYKHDCRNNMSCGMSEEKSEPQTCFQCQRIVHKIQELEQRIDEHVSMFRCDAIHHRKTSYAHIDAIQLMTCKIKELEQLLNK